MGKITDIRYIFRIGEWVLANPAGDPGHIGYVYGEADGEYLVHAVDGDIACPPQYMRRLTNQQVLECIQSFQRTFICSHTDLMDDIPEQLGLFKE